MQINKTDSSKMIPMIRDISKAADEKEVLKVLFSNSRGLDDTYSKTTLLEEYKRLKGSGKLVLTGKEEDRFLDNIKTKKIRINNEQLANKKIKRSAGNLRYGCMG